MRFDSSLKIMVQVLVIDVVECLKFIRFKIFSIIIIMDDDLIIILYIIDNIDFNIMKMIDKNNVKRKYVNCVVKILEINIFQGFVLILF